MVLLHRSPGDPRRCLRATSTSANCQFGPARTGTAAASRHEKGLLGREPVAPAGGRTCTCFPVATLVTCGRAHGGGTRRARRRGTRPGSRPASAAGQRGPGDLPPVQAGCRPGRCPATGMPGHCWWPPPASAPRAGASTTVTRPSTVTSRTALRRRSVSGLVGSRIPTQIRSGRRTGWTSRSRPPAPGLAVPLGSSVSVW